MKRIPYGRQHISEPDIQAVVEVLRSDFLTQGPKIKEFEEAFAAYIGSRYAVAVANGTAALHLSGLALGIRPGDKVITTPITFSATANCVRYAGGEVVFADIDPNTYLLDIEKVEERLKEADKGTYKGIIPVDLAGRAVNTEAFRKLADKYGLWIIEDACHAPGGYFVDSNNKKQRCGNCVYTDLAIFSFHPVKHIAAGEGGMITTNSREIFEKLLNLRTHGIQQNPDKKVYDHGIWYYEMQELGYNYRLTDIQAALGLSQLQRADEGLAKRKELAARYAAAFKGLDWVIGQSDVVDGHAYHLYILEVKNRNGLLNYLRSKEIFCQVHYIPVHLMPYYRAFGWNDGNFEAAENYYSRCLSIPLFPTLTDEEQQYVIASVKAFYTHG